MRYIKLTNQQIKDMVAEFRRQLKDTKSRSGKIELSYPLTNLKNHPKAEVLFTPTADKKLNALVQECAKEIGWHGTVVRDPNVSHRFVIEDIVVFPQTVTSVTVTPNETEYALWLADLPDDVFNKLRFHGHSHVHMATNPSATDVQYQENILENLNDFYIFGIFNKRGKVWMLIYDIENNVLYEDSDIVYTCCKAPEEEWALKEIKKKVKEMKPPKTNKPTKSDPSRTFDVYMYPPHYGRPPKGAQQVRRGALVELEEEEEDETGQLTMDMMEDNANMPDWYAQYCGK